MARAIRGSSASAWRRRFRRYSRSSLTVSEFCSKEEVSVASFYAWKRKLDAVASNGASDGGPSAPPAFRPVSLVGPAPVMSAKLPGGLQLEVSVADVELIRGVVAELVRADDVAVRGESPC